MYLINTNMLSYTVMNKSYEYKYTKSKYQLNLPRLKFLRPVYHLIYVNYMCHYC